MARVRVLECAGKRGWKVESGLFVESGDERVIALISAYSALTAFELRDEKETIG